LGACLENLPKQSNDNVNADQYLPNLRITSGKEQARWVRWVNLTLSAHQADIAGDDPPESALDIGSAGPGMAGAGGRRGSLQSGGDSPKESPWPSSNGLPGEGRRCPNAWAAHLRQRARAGRQKALLVREFGISRETVYP